MKTNEKMHQNKQENIERKRNQTHEAPEPDLSPIYQPVQNAQIIGETPFQPPLKTHADWLSQKRSSNEKAHLVLQLQRAYGNAYVHRMLSSLKVQAELKISSPDDVYEQEADRVAEKVMQRMSSGIQRQEEEEELQAKPISYIHRQEKDEYQSESIPEALNQEEELQSKPAESHSGAVSGNLEKRINTACGSGQNLPGKVRQDMEQSFGADFRDVRVHTDSEADSLNLQLNARAFTRGQDIFFSQGEYNPVSADGQKLIAHELTHVLQQGAASVSRQSAGKPVKDGETREESEVSRNPPEWGQTVKSDVESVWSISSSPSGAKISWAAETPAAVNQSREISWGTSQQSADVKGRDSVPRAINSSTVTSLVNLETAHGAGTRGVAPWPTAAVAPSFDYNITEEKGEDGKAQFTARPSITQNHYEGNSQPLHLGSGLQKTTSTEGGVEVYENISASISQLDAAAENEHGNDYKYACQISIGEAEDVIQNHLCTQSFGPKGTRGEVEQMVLDTFKSNLPHPQLGTDKTQWLNKYTTLQRKTLDRDNKGWHTFTTNNRQEVKDDKGKVIKVTYDLVKSSTTKINQVPSKDVITY